MDSFPTSTDLRASIKLACDIAGASADRFNEAVHAGFYPCAPKTKPGRARSFDRDDVVALRIYQGDMNAGMSAKAAGEKACMLRQFMHEHPDAPHAYLVSTPFGARDYVFSEFDVTQGMVNINPTQAIEVTSVEVINLTFHRRIVVFKITEADKHRVVGD